jgi:hypothetical protein
MAPLLDEMDRVVLTEDLSEEELQAGDEGLVVMVYRHGVGGYTGPDGYTVEFRRDREEEDWPEYRHVNLHPDQVRPIRHASDEKPAGINA